MSEKNFPPCYPLVRHSWGDIEDSTRKTFAILCFIEFIVTSVLFLVNFIGGILGLVASQSKDAYVGVFVLSLIYFLLGVPAAFILQYWPAYAAARSGNSLRYYIFFFAYFVAIIFMALMVCGIPTIGSCGLVTAIGLLDEDGNAKNAAVALFFIMTGAWFINLWFVVFLFVYGYHNYNNDEGSFSSAKKQLFTKFARNSVRNSVGI
eukprot:gb/GECH01012168.1/.p1 GENE.gb/GECH01012168.1/~~gb/GECH01012168.1/.p1  ORF type:complete len:206 (+),score=39.44 gb/GECH01012168.1/:1-618(+)